MTAKRKRKPLPRLRNGKIENPHRPRIHLDEPRGGMARATFRGRMDPDRSDRIPDGGTEPQEHYRFRGYITDLPSLAYGSGGTEYDTFEDALDDYEVERGTPCGTDGGPALGDLEARLRSAADRCLLTGRLYRTLLQEHALRGVPIHPHRVSSPGTYAWGIERVRGQHPPLYAWPDFPRDILAGWMGALHGGENRIGLIAPPEVAVQVVPLDFTGGHVAVASLIGIHELKTAEHVEVRERDPGAVEAYVERLAMKVRRWLDHPGPIPPLTRKDWRRLARTLAWVSADADAVPHRTRLDGNFAWRMRVSPLISEEPVPFVLLAALRSALETGKVPRIVRASRLVVSGRADGLSAITLPDGAVVTPGDDVPLALAAMRRRLDTLEISEPARKRLGDWAKLVGNAMVSGNPAQTYRHDLRDRTARVHVWDPAGSHRVIRTAVVEEPGAWYFPPIAAAVTTAMQFLLFLARSLVEARGGRTLYEAIDSLAVIASPDGGVLRNPGCGTVVERDTGEVVEGVLELLWLDVEAVRQAMEAFCPYPDVAHAGRPDGTTEPLLLKIEKEAFDTAGRQREVYMWAISPLRAYTYTVERSEAGRIMDVEVVKPSRQSLGQLIAPPGAGEDWIAAAAAYHLRTRFGLEATEPPGWDRPALAVLPVTIPGESMDRLGADRRPWTPIVVARPHQMFGPKLADGTAALPAALWHEGFDPAAAAWFDYRTGQPIRGRVRVAPGGARPTYGPHGWILTYRQVIAWHFARVPDGVLGPDGEPATSQTLGLLRHAPTEAHRSGLIGREANRLERVGVTTGPVYADYTDEARVRLLALGVLRDHGVPMVAKATRYPRSSVRLFLQTGRTSRARWETYVEVAGALALDALIRWDLSLALPKSPESRCYMYLREAGRVRRTCRGCGATLTGRQRRWCSKACEMRTRRHPPV